MHFANSEVDLLTGTESQRIFMHLLLKSGGDTTVQFLVATVPPGKPPDQFRQHGLRNLPAIIYKETFIDIGGKNVKLISRDCPFSVLCIMLSCSPMLRYRFEG